MTTSSTKEQASETIEKGDKVEKTETLRIREIAVQPAWQRRIAPVAKAVGKGLVFLGLAAGAGYVGGRQAIRMGAKQEPTNDQMGQ